MKKFLGWKEQVKSGAISATQALEAMSAAAFGSKTHAWILKRAKQEQATLR
jgi:hypothetical protein